MWEVFTRQSAWHWIQGGANKDLAIMNQVLLSGNRPRVPKGMLEQPARMMRGCLHTEPEERPKCNELTDWLDRMRTRLDMAIETAKTAKVSERSQGMTYADVGWWLTERKDPVSAVHWNQGRYSLYKTNSVTSRGQSTFTLRVEGTGTQSDWMEKALVGDEHEPPQDIGTLPALNKEPFGLVFKVRAQHACTA